MHWCFPCLPTISNSLPEQSHYSFTFLSRSSRFLNHCHTKAETLGLLSRWKILDPEELIISSSNLFKPSFDLLLRPSVQRSQILLGFDALQPVFHAQSLGLKPSTFSKSLLGFLTSTGKEEIWWLMKHVNS